MSSRNTSVSPYSALSIQAGAVCSKPYQAGYSCAESRKSDPTSTTRTPRSASTGAIAELLPAGSARNAAWTSADTISSFGRRVRSENGARCDQTSPSDLPAASCAPTNATSRIGCAERRRSSSAPEYPEAPSTATGMGEPALACMSMQRIAGSCTVANARGLLAFVEAEQVVDRLSAHDDPRLSVAAHGDGRPGHDVVVARHGERVRAGRDGHQHVAGPDRFGQQRVVRHDVPGLAVLADDADRQGPAFVRAICHHELVPRAVQRRAD